MTQTLPKLTHDTIGDLQAGGIGYAIDASIREAMSDCDRRPSLKKPRTVTIQVTITPAADSLDMSGSNDRLQTVGIKAQVGVKLPGRAGGEEYLNVAHTNTDDGEAEVAATFAQDTLLRAQKGGN